MKTLNPSDNVHKRFRILSVKTDKKLYELLEEAVELLEKKYNQEIEHDGSRDDTIIH